MAQPLNIRQVIRDNLEELEGLGIIHAVRENTGMRGRPATAYYLNEEQALTLCAMGRTQRAKEVRGMLIKVFVSYRRGELVPAEQRPQLPDFTNPAEAARAWAQCAGLTKV